MKRFSHFAQMARMIVGDAKLRSGRLFIKKPGKKRFVFSGYILKNNVVYNSQGEAVYNHRFCDLTDENTYIQELYNLTRAFALIEGDGSEVWQKAKKLGVI